MEIKDENQLKELISQELEKALGNIAQNISSQLTENILQDMVDLRFKRSICCSFGWKLENVEINLKNKGLLFWKNTVIINLHAKTGEVFALSLYNEDTGKYGNRDKNIYILFT